MVGEEIEPLIISRYRWALNRTRIAAINRHRAAPYHDAAMPNWRKLGRKVIMADYSIREGRLRGDCERRGWRLMKSRRGEEGDTGSGSFMIVDVLTGTVLAGGRPRAFSMTIEEVEHYLAARSKGTRQRLVKPTVATPHG
jgi:hypothetical protein